MIKNGTEVTEQTTTSDLLLACHMILTKIKKDHCANITYCYGLNYEVQYMKYMHGVRKIINSNKQSPFMF